ncbi:MAG: mannose-1-phosphate guanylyltransferase [Candidatus Kapabacteria bacterium]|nr:mannose-1-phosphate guanylyltransferase [Candidatus Kapabacteria bacterium]
MNSYVVIMAGGSGERFWPLSRMRKPKQLLHLTSPDLSMIEEAIARVEPLIPRERILIITSEVLRQPIINALPNLPAENVIAEPAKRNTAPCLALACSVIEQREGGDALMAVLTADHFIGNAKSFRKDIAIALHYAQDNDALVTMGIPPTRPETGYGYIHVAESIAEDEVSSVDSFKEKPTFEIAREYVLSGRYLWNSGMFFWRTHTLRDVMIDVLPEVGNRIAEMTTHKSHGDEVGLGSLFAALPDISIDYGVMERAKNVFVVPASFPWDDVGSWDALERMQPLDADRNVVQGATLVMETTGSVVVNAHSGSHIVTTIGLEDVVVVVTDDATMVCMKDRTQDVKKIVTALRAEGRDDIL